MSRPRSTNGDLERVWERTGWSRKELAQRVNRRGHIAVYQEADVMRGGGHARRALAQYVTGHVLPLVRDADPDYEDGRQALAQRYLVQSLRLAQAGTVPHRGTRP